MTDFNLGTYIRKKRSLKFYLFILLPFLFTGSILLFSLDGNLSVEIAIILLFLIFIDIGVIIAVLTRKFYNWIIAFLFLIIIAVALRHQRLPFAGLAFTLGFGGLGSVWLFSSVKFLKRYSHLPFLRYIGFSSCIVLFLVSMALLWKSNHWPLADIMLTIGMITFITFLFAFIFTLPNANYLNWNNEERVIFFRAIILPLIFIYSISVLMFVFPEAWISLTRSSPLPFGMEQIELIKKPGF